MRAAELTIGQEYEITAQRWVSPKYRWRAKHNPGRVKLLSEHSDGRYLCEYLPNPYSEDSSLDGEGQVVVSSRSLIRPWQDVVAEQEARLAQINSYQQAEQQREAEALTLIEKNSWLRAELTAALIDIKPDGRLGETTIGLEIPLSVLRGIIAQAQKHGAPEEIPPAEPSTALGEILAAQEAA